MDRRIPKRWLAAGVVAFGTLFGAAAQAQPAGRDAGPPGMSMPGPGMFAGRPEGIARRVDRMLDGVGATDAQRAQVRQIVQSAAADLAAQREAGRALRLQGLQIFTAPTVDATAAEALRQQMLAQHNQTSKRTLQAMLEIAAVLTPEQRATLAERMHGMHERMRDRAPRTAPGNG